MNNTKRLFFALWPDDKTRHNISDAFNKTSQSKSHGRCLKAGNLHLTLHFLGNVSQDKYNCVEEIADTVKGSSFELILNHYDSFSKAKIYWLGADTIPAALSRLHLELANALKECDYSAEKRPFNPHITLMRKIQLPVEAALCESIIWKVNQFALVESVSIEDGVEYNPLKIYTL